MPHYLFTHDARDNSFPERYRVVSPDEDADFLRDTESLTGTVLDTEAIGFLEELMTRFQADDSIGVELVDAPYWKFIELRFKSSVEADAEDAPTKHPYQGIVR
jgi:hypothetical protein